MSYLILHQAVETVAFFVPKLITQGNVATRSEVKRFCPDFPDRPSPPHPHVSSRLESGIVFDSSDSAVLCGHFSEIKVVNYGQTFF